MASKLTLKDHVSRGYNSHRKSFRVLYWLALIPFYDVDWLEPSYIW